MMSAQIDDEGQWHHDEHTIQSSSVDLGVVEKVPDSATNIEWNDDSLMTVAARLPSVGDESMFEQEISEQLLIWRGKKSLLRGRGSTGKDDNTPRSLLFMRNRNTARETNVAEAAISNRQLHDVVNHTDNYNSTVAFLHESPKSPLADNSASVNAGQRTGSLLLYIIMVLILAPCLAAAVAQAVYTWKKRARDRRDRQLAEVSTNPGGRRLILDEILKGNTRVSAKLLFRYIFISFQNENFHFQLPKHWIHFVPMFHVSWVGCHWRRSLSA